MPKQPRPRQIVTRVTITQPWPGTADDMRMARLLCHQGIEAVLSDAVDDGNLSIDATWSIE